MPRMHERRIVDSSRRRRTTKTHTKLALPPGAPLFGQNEMHVQSPNRPGMAPLVRSVQRLRLQSSRLQVCAATATMRRWPAGACQPGGPWHRALSSDNDAVPGAAPMMMSNGMPAIVLRQADYCRCCIHEDRARGQRRVVRRWPRPAHRLNCASTQNARLPFWSFAVIFTS